LVFWSESLKKKAYFGERVSGGKTISKWILKTQSGKCRLTLLHYSELDNKSQAPKANVLELP
jgi:hypothetical protein